MNETTNGARKKSIKNTYQMMDTDSRKISALYKDREIYVCRADYICIGSISIVANSCELFQTRRVRAKRNREKKEEGQRYH